MTQTEIWRRIVAGRKLRGMTVAELIEKLKPLPPELPVTYVCRTDDAVEVGWVEVEPGETDGLPVVRLI